MHWWKGVWLTATLGQETASIYNIILNPILERVCHEFTPITSVIGCEIANSIECHGSPYEEQTPQKTAHPNQLILVLL